MIDTEDLTSYISGYDDYCEPEKEIPEDDRDFYEDYLLEKGKTKMERKIIYLSEITLEEAEKLTDYVWKDDKLIPLEMIEGE